MPVAKTHTSINVSLTPTLREKIQKGRDSTGIPYAQQIEFGFQLVKGQNLEEIAGDPFKGTKKQKVFSVSMETDEALTKYAKEKKATKTALVQRALLTFLEAHDNKTLKSFPEPLLRDFDDQVLINELQLRGYSVRKG